MIMEDVVRRYREGAATITAVMVIVAETEHTRYAVVTDDDGRLVGSYFPADVAQQTGWQVITPDDPAPVSVPTEAHATIRLIGGLTGHT
jgi:hypothetical protein